MIVMQGIYQQPGPPDFKPIDHILKSVKETISKILKRLPTLEEFKTNKVALINLGFKVIGSGAEKHVLIPANNLVHSAGEEAKAFYVPVRKFIFSKKNALKQEHAKMEDIKSKLSESKYLAVDSKVIRDKERFGHSFALEVNKAEKDFEGELRDINTTIPQRLRYGLEYSRGMTELHKAGYAYGDIKPENCLIYKDSVTEEKSLKIADFGKAQKVADGEKRTYTGNLRFAPPEGVLSKSGDVFGAALVLIRTLEDPLLENGNSLIPVGQEDQDTISEKALDKRRGVEQLIVNHKAFPGIDEPDFPAKLFRRLPRQATLAHQSEETKNTQVKVLHQYIDVLTNTLVFNGLDKSSAKDLNELLKDMVNVSPEKRPSMEQVANRLEAILESKS